MSRTPAQLPPPSPASAPQISPAQLRAWRVLLAMLTVAVCWLAFDPHPPSQADTGWDKLNHLLAFTVLTVCACLAFANSPRRWVGVPLALLAFGGFIELVQTQVPGRTGEWPDLLADGVGIAAGLLLMRAVRATTDGRKVTARRLTP